MTEQEIALDSSGTETSGTDESQTHHGDIASVRELILGAFSDLVPSSLADRPSAN